MTNLASRKVVAGEVLSIIPYAGGPPTLSPIADGMPKPFNPYALIVSIGRWAESYNQDRDKFLSFIERYDLTISDSRMAQFTFPDAASND